MSRKLKFKTGDVVQVKKNIKNVYYREMLGDQTMVVKDYRGYGGYLCYFPHNKMNTRLLHVSAMELAFQLSDEEIWE